VDRRIPVRALNFAWNRLGGPSLDRLVGAPLDLVHSPHPLLVPGRRARRVVTVHDLFFLKNPDLTRAEIRRDYVPLVRAHVRRADGVVCGSEFTAGEIRRLLDVPPEKLAVTPYGIDPIYRQPVGGDEVEEVLGRLGLPRGAILYVGSDEKRKNVVNLAMAYMGLARRRGRTPPLLLVGPGSGWAQGGSDVGPQIRATGYLAQRDLRALMAASALLVLPSLEEGFGLPVAEALAAGLPVVCSRGSALEEIANGAATLVDPLDTGSIAEGMERVLDDTTYTEAQRQRGLERSRSFDWDVTARRTLEFYRRLLAR
jgi:glycosyltransferase involved in cell wall biosynthesis